MFPCDVSSSDPRASFEYNVGNTETRTQLLGLPIWASFPVHQWWWILSLRFPSLLCDPLILTDWWACSHGAPKMQHQSHPQWGASCCVTCCVVLLQIVLGAGWVERAILILPVASLSQWNIDNPKSHQALALESVASLSCGKSSEWSLQPTIGIDCDWLHQKKEIMEEYWTVLTGWLGLDWT